MSDDWVTAMPKSNAVQFKYGKKGTSTSTFPGYSSMHTADETYHEDFDEATSSSIEIKNFGITAMNAKKVKSSKFGQDHNASSSSQDLVEKKRKALACRFDDNKSSKAKLDVKCSIANAKLEDLNYLFEQIRNSEEKPKTPAGFAGLEVEAPVTWAMEDRNRFEEWILSIGFQCKVVRNCIVYRYMTSKVVEFKAHVISSREITRSRLAFEGHRSKSEGQLADPSLINAAVFSATALPLNIDTKPFRQYRVSKDEVSEESSVADSPAPVTSPQPFSPDGRLRLTCGFHPIRLTAQSRSSSVSELESREVVETEQDDMDFGDQIGQGMNQLILSQRRRSSASSVELLDSALVADASDSDDSLSTVGAEMFEVHVTADTSSNALEDSPEHPFLAPRAQSMHSPQVSLAKSLSIDHHSYRERRQRESRLRLRRSKSVPVEVVQRVTELTPGKCFSQNTQTPLRREVPKIFSGMDVACDWGSSQESCAESIRCLQDLHYRSRAHTTGDINATGSTFGPRSPSSLHHTMASAFVGSLLASPYISSPLDEGKASRPSTSVTPSFSSTFKYISPLVSSVQSLIRSPMSHRKSTDFDFISEENISMARKALQSMLPGSLGLSNPSIVDRKKSRLNKSCSKWRRVSIGLNSCMNASRDTSLSPAPVSKCRAKVNSRLSFSRDSDTRDSLESAGASVKVFAFSKYVRTDYVSLTSNNFKGVLIGGTYQSCFERGLPLVAAPSTYEKRIAACRMSEENGLTLEIYIAKDCDMKTVCLGRDWCCLRAYPDGYIVFKETPIFLKKFVCYFSPKDPIEWIKCDSPYSVSARKVKFVEHVSEELHRMEEAEVANDDEDDNMSTGSTNNLSSSGSYLEFNAADESLMTDVVVEPEMKTYANWNDSNVVCLVLEFLIGPANSRGRNGRRKNVSGKSAVFNQVELLQYQAVSKDWALGCFRLVAKLLSDSRLRKDYSGWGDFVKKFARGEFLTSGACKEVFRVHNHSADKLEAVSIMDINDLEKRGMDFAVYQELEISLVCSSLFDLNICPNLIKVHSVFQSEFNAPEDLWKKSTGRPFLPSLHLMAPVAVPKLSSLIRGKYQYIRMEFCKGGDLESFVRDKQHISVSTITSFLFQMLYALYTCREKLSLRHFDIKLLNFFVTTGSSLISADGRSDHFRTASESVFGKATIPLEIGFGNRIFDIPCRHDELDVVKLADFGTSVIGAGMLGDRIGVNQFTTLENTPIEYLVCGSDARQAYSADTFCLGLSFLHLLTGNEPYEEHLRDVKCPDYLRLKLTSIWEHVEDPSSPYFVITEVIGSLQSDGDDCSTTPCVLYDTLYRYLVLFGVPSEFDDPQYQMPWHSSPVWEAVMDSLRLGVFAQRAKSACINAFHKDSALWNFYGGTHVVMKSARDRLKEMNGGLELFRALIHFDPSRRCPLKEALLSPLFKCLEKLEKRECVPPHKSANRGEYKHYYRSHSLGGSSSLPLF